MSSTIWCGYNYSKDFENGHFNFEFLLTVYKTDGNFHEKDSSDPVFTILVIAQQNTMEYEILLQLFKFYLQVWTSLKFGIGGRGSDAAFSHALIWPWTPFFFFQIEV